MPNNLTDITSSASHKKLEREYLLRPMKYYRLSLRHTKSRFVLYCPLTYKQDTVLNRHLRGFCNW